MRVIAAFLAAVLFCGPSLALPAGATPPEPPSLAEAVAAGTLPPISKRLPAEPLVADFASRGRTAGQYGGTIRTIVSKLRDLRYITVMNYTRLVGYDENRELKPDLVASFTNEGDRIFTFTLRAGHKWSDGSPFTTEDFRYYWEDMANNKELSRLGPIDLLLVDGQPPKVTILSPLQIRYEWAKPNPRFLPALAQPRPLYIYAPSHYLKKFHARYGDVAKLNALAASRQMRSWSALHTKLNDNYESTNVDLPTLDPWVIKTSGPDTRFVFERNPYFHRVDPDGRQLPYIDRIVVDSSSPGLFAAKANAGEVDLLARGLTMNDVPVLKEGEATHAYRTLLWPIADGSAFALYPNLTTSDPVWRKVLRDVRFRRALSMAIDRHTLNNALWFGLGTEGNNTVRPESPLYDPSLRTMWAQFDTAAANRLLDAMGLKLEPSGFRMLPDGRPLDILVDCDEGAGDIVDALQITAEFWADIGVRLIVKSEDASALRDRSYAGLTTMVATTGLDNAVPTAIMSPSELAPVRQDNAAWSQWGQYSETNGLRGEKPDTPEAQQLLGLYQQWQTAGSADIQAEAWRGLLKLHADNQWVIGTVSGDLQPIVVSDRLRNIPDKALFSWEPTALIGAYRVDEFYFDDKSQQASAR